MIEAPVGFQCPGCVTTASKRMRATRPSLRSVAQASRAIVVIIGINVAVWVAIALTGGDTSSVASVLGLNLLSLCDLPGATYVGVEPALCAAEGGFYSPGTADFALWKLLTSGFTHISIIHLGFNMVVLWLIGPQLNHYFGTARFVGLYLVSILAGSLLSLWASPDNTFGVGASGGLFGLLGALLVVSLLRGGDVRRILLLLGVNAVFTVWGAGVISWQAHLGGFVGGCLATYGLLKMDGRPPRAAHLWLLGVGAVCVVGALARGFVA